MIMAIIILIQDHLYHELEPRETVHHAKDNALHATHTRDLELSSEIVAGFIQPQAHPPVYQEIADLPVTK